MLVTCKRFAHSLKRRLKRVERFDLEGRQSAAALPDLASTHHAARIRMHARGVAALLADMLARILYVTTTF
jgi:hypothetical protein